MTERTTSQIIGFRRNGESGELTYLGATATENQPRDFAIDPLGQFLIVAGEKSGHATVYSIDAESGELISVDRAATGTDSAWVEILTVIDD